MSRKKIILFDIDSTLLKDGGALSAAFETAFMEMFSLMPLRVDKHGQTDPNIIRKTSRITLKRDLTHSEDARLRARYCELYPEYLEKTRAFSLLEGARELCSTLGSDPACCLGLQTGNLEPCAWIKLKKANLDPFFLFGGFGSDHANRTLVVKTAIERGAALAGVEAGEAQVFVIGDSIHDIAAGNRNNAFTIGVATGKDSPRDLSAAKADAVVPDLSASSGIFKLLSGGVYSQKRM